MIWACSSKTKDTSKPNDDVAVKEAYLRVVTALRKCDRPKLQGLLTPKTWAIATMAKAGKGDLVDMMCRATVKGDVTFEEVTINNDRASIMVKLGNQPPKEVIMSKINGQWLMGEAGKVPAGLKKATNHKIHINPAIIRQQIKKPHRFKVTNLHMNTKIIPGSGRGSHKTIGTGKAQKPVK